MVGVPFTTELVGSFQVPPGKPCAPTLGRSGVEGADSLLQEHVLMPAAQGSQTAWQNQVSP